MKQKLIPIVSVVIGIFAFFLTERYLSSERAKVQEQIDEFYRKHEAMYVVAAARDIPSGTRISPDDVGKLEVLKRSVRDRAVLPEQVDLIFGKKVMFNIQANSPILWSDVEGGGLAYGGLASMISHGMRAISLNIAGAQGVSGMVQPNDRVDVLGTFTFPVDDNPELMENVTLTVLQNVTVLATGQTLAKHLSLQGPRRRSGGYSTITLEVTPNEAELLVFAEQTRGQLTLALRNPADVSFESQLPEVNFGHLQTELPKLNARRQARIGGKAMP